MCWAAEIGKYDRQAPWPCGSRFEKASKLHDCRSVVRPFNSVTKQIQSGSPLDGLSGAYSHLLFLGMLPRCPKMSHGKGRKQLDETLDWLHCSFSCSAGALTGLLISEGRLHFCRSVEICKYEIGHVGPVFKKRRNLTTAPRL